MPCGADSEHLTRGGDLARRGQPADRGNMTADEINPAVGHQGQPLAAVHEQFAHGQGRGTLLPHELEPCHVFRSHGVFQKEEAERFHGLGQNQRLCGRNAFMHVVDQVHVEANLRAQVVEHLHGVVDVRRRLKDRGSHHAVRTRLQNRVGRGVGYAVSRESWHGELDADVPVASLHRLAHLVFQLRQFARGGMGVQRGRGAHLASQQFVHRQVGALAHNVPQRAIDTGKCVVQRDALPEVGRQVGRLPDVLNVIHVPADDERLQVIVDGGDHGQGPLPVRRAAYPVKPRLACHHLHHHQVIAARLSHDGLHVGDLYRPRAARLGGDGGHRGHGAAGGEEAKCVASIHIRLV